MHFPCFPTPSQTSQQHLPTFPLLPACYLRCKAVSVWPRWSSPSFPTCPQMVRDAGEHQAQPCSRCPGAAAPLLCSSDLSPSEPRAEAFSCVSALLLGPGLGAPKPRANRAQKNKVRQGKRTTWADPSNHRCSRVSCSRKASAAGNTHPSPVLSFTQVF